MSQIINDEEELNTATDPDLKTEYYELEILGLKNVVDLRKFSRSFMKVSKLINKIEEKIQNINICPYRVGDILQTTNSQNPSEYWKGTQWKLITNFLKGVNEKDKVGEYDGEDSVAIERRNLPNFKLKTEEHTHPNSPHEHSVSGGSDTRYGGASRTNGESFRDGNWSGYYRNKAYGVSVSLSPASPYTEPLGDGEKLSIIPKHYKVYMWERIA